MNLQIQLKRIIPNLKLKLAQHQVLGTQNFLRILGEIDYHCRNKILNSLTINLYATFHTCKIVKEFWDDLEDHYTHIDTGIVRYTISQFHSFKMVDPKPINDQIEEFKILVRGISESYTILKKNYQVACLIDKLPPSWSNVANHLKHKQGKMSLGDVFNSLRIEE